ncbi:MAG: bifunctional (p)ppGpp synthetase/guanosine-3',5'-bis(diphosphate) 3'-pyrophosphohydrolase [Anaerolineae bacterium]|nr:bifunctional (p)ppGpp synthetase/guanosine-3',5'-bis(diphosphate) 3'-pyrophosphohydrolase [Anaerolineae bacterium]
MTMTTFTPTSLEDLTGAIPRLNPNDRALIERAYRKAETVHQGQFRKSGEPYFTHCVAVAAILADLKLEADAIAAGLLHDTVEDTGVTVEELREEFGTTIARLVEGVTKLKHIPVDAHLNKDKAGRKKTAINKDLEYIRRMFMHMGEDIRVMFIKLADRLHNMRTLGYMKLESQQRIARETMDIFAPLANRLGIWQIKWELEDLSLRYLDPETYRTIAARIDERRADREAYMNAIVEKLKAEMAKQGLTNVTIVGRPKHINSIYNKMRRKNVPFEQVFDVRAVRVIVQQQSECYQALGVVHNLWKPIPREFDDYIAQPKDNHYQSLHTAVYDDRGKTVEVQIRTWEMHHHAEYGIAAHWKYKEGVNNDPEYERRLNALRKMMEFGQDVDSDADEYVDALKTEFFQDRVYAVTPKGEIIDLPAGATPIDFAYHIHTDIGHRARGARVNGQQVRLNYKLKSGDQVEIITVKQSRPSRDWLNDDAGYCITSRAREKIRHFFRKLDRDQHIAMGRDTVERELNRLGLSNSIQFSTLAELLGYEEVEDFFAAVGVGDVNSSQISNRALEEERRRQHERDIQTQPEKLFKPRTQRPAPSTGAIMGVRAAGMLTKIAPCCNPVPGDDIVGFITRGRGVTIHRATCTNILNMADSERTRLIEVSWGERNDTERYVVPLDVVAYDRTGLASDITSLVADERINIHDLRVIRRGDISTISLKVEVSEPRQVTRLISLIQQVNSVTDVYRPHST